MSVKALRRSIRKSALNNNNNMKETRDNADMCHIIEFLTWMTDLTNTKRTADDEQMNFENTVLITLKNINACHLT